MSDVADSAKAKLVLDELEQRTRLMKLVRDEGKPWFPWAVVPVVIGFFALLLWPWDIRDTVVDVYGFLALLGLVLGELASDTRRLKKQVDALVKILARDGVLQDQRAVG